MKNLLSKNNLISLLIFMPYFFSFSASAIIENSSKVLVPLILLSALLVFLTEKDIKKMIVNNFSSPLYKVVLTMAIYSIASYYIHGFSSTGVRSLVSLSVLLLITPWYRLPKNTSNYLFLIGSITVFFNSMYYIVWLGESRYAGPVNPIPYATFCALLFTTSLCFLIYEKRLIHKFLAIISIITSATGIILSESRGIWIAIAITIFALSIMCIRNNQITWRPFLIIFMCSVISLFFLKDVIHQRILTTEFEIEKIQSGHMNTSIGLRLQMWTLSKDIVKDNYIFGIGTNIQDKINDLYERKIALERIYNYSPTHLHNQFIDSFVKNGAIGLALILSLLYIPLRNMKKYNLLDKSIATSAVLVVSVACLTDVPLSHPSSFMAFCLLLFPLTLKYKKDSLND